MYDLAQREYIYTWRRNNVKRVTLDFTFDEYNKLQDEFARCKDVYYRGGALSFSRFLKNLIFDSAEDFDFPWPDE